MEQNKVNNRFEYANKKACELAIIAKEKSKKEILIFLTGDGSSSPQRLTLYPKGSS